MSEKREERIARIALVPGSFDPPTTGHKMLIDYAARKYEKVYVVIFQNAEKTCMFGKDERLKMVEALCRPYANAIADCCDGMVWKYAKEKSITVSVRGYRNEEDLAYERAMAVFNKNANCELGTELIKCDEKMTLVSSTRVRDAIEKGEDFTTMMPAEAAEVLRRILITRNVGFGGKNDCKKM